MEVILSQQCLSLVGTLERGLGYHIEHRKNGFFSKRNQRGHVPSDGHWRFIVLCAEMAQNGLYIKDVRISAKEFQSALNEAGLFSSAAHDVRHELSATDIIKIHRYYLPDMV